MSLLTYLHTQTFDRSPNHPSTCHSLIHSLAHSLAHSLIHSLTHSFTHSHTRSLTHSLTTHSLAHSLIHSLTQGPAIVYPSHHPSLVLKGSTGLQDQRAQRYSCMIICPFGKCSLQEKALPLLLLDKAAPLGPACCLCYGSSLGN